MLNFVGDVHRRDPYGRRTHARPLRAGAHGRRRDCRRDPDDRAGADAHLLGHDVLPLRVPRDLDRALRPQRERRVRVRHAPRLRQAFDREPADAALAAVCRRHRAGARRARAHPRRAELLAREPREDDRDLHAGRSPFFHRRGRHLPRDYTIPEARERGLWRRPDRRRDGLPPAAAAAEPLRRARRRAARGGPRRRRGAALLAGQDDGPHGGDRCPGRGDTWRLAAVGIGAVRRQQHQGARRGHGAVREMEFVLAGGRVRPVARRLVAQLALQGGKARDTVHGHRLGRFDPHRPIRRRFVRGRVPASTSSPASRFT